MERETTIEYQEVFDKNELDEKKKTNQVSASTLAMGSWEIEDDQMSKNIDRWNESSEFGELRVHRMTNRNAKEEIIRFKISVVRAATRFL